MSGKKRDRDRATEAFRRWARAGCPEPDEIRCGSGEVAEDFRACAAVFAVLLKDRRENGNGIYVVKAVKAVYMAEPFRNLRRNEITLRVRAMARENYICERQVFAWLAKARGMWFKYRG